MPYMPNTQVTRGLTGATGATGPTGPTGPAGSGGASIYEYQLAGNTLVGDTTITLDRTPSFPVYSQQYLVIDAGTAQAEIRKVNSTPVSSSVTLASALEYAHAANDFVLVVESPSLSTSVWGCLGDNSTDDHTALQEAIVQTTVNGSGIWLDGENRTHVVSQPILSAPSAKIRHITIKAKATFAPAEANNALVMTMQGNIRAFTAATSDVITTSSAHGIPADGIRVVFQGSSMPTGLTAGKVYYAYNRTPTTFTVSASVGGPTVDITSTGSGKVFCEVLSLSKSYLDDVFIEGNNVAGLNGIWASLQQPGFWNKVRVDDCPETGAIIGGQQHVFTNFESINCQKALVLDSASFMWFYGFNAEQCDRGIYVDTLGAENCLFSGCHFEMNSGSGYADASSIAIEVTSGCNNLTIQNLSVTMSVIGQTIFQVSAGITTGYTISDARLAGGPSTTGLLFVNDLMRGIALDAWDDCRHHIALVAAPTPPSSFLYTDPYPYTVLGPSGRRVSWGSTKDSQPSHHVRVGSTQAGAAYQVEDNSGNILWDVGVTGFVEMKEQTDPAAPASNFGRLYVRDNGAGKSQLVVRFPTGSVQVIATEP